ncbi:phosphodiesterase [Arthrobacter sp. 35W]|uniref:phosphodiesterase n=1 Tax=Arthrobacter sp. 35W TaxID=1132441 RepID=UPI000429EEC6|nr:phosphodiesterase [Arthrobacter sp. 35W]
MKRIEAEHPRPRHFLLHLSDTHLLGSGAPLYGAVDSAARLRQLFTELAASGSRPQAVVVTGDLADKGEPAAYATLRSIVEPACVQMGAKIIWAMGNHDDRAHFRAALLDAPLGAPAAPGQTSGAADGGRVPGHAPGPVADPMAPVDHCHYVDGLRIITLDTTVPGFHHGELSPEQLHWLADELSTPAPDGTVLALHHPPVPSVLDLAVLVELRGQAALAEVLRGSDVRIILAGHLHYSTTAMFAGIPVSVASATCYAQDLNVPTGGTRGQDAGQSYNLVHLYEHTVVSSVVPLGSAATVGEYVDAAETQRRLAAAGITIPERSAQHPPSRRATSPRVP